MGSGNANWRNGSAAVIVAAVITSAHASTMDQEVTEVVLKHFADRQDASIPKEGVILVRPSTQTWTEERMRGFAGLREASGPCRVPEELFVEFAKRNPRQSDASALIGNSTRWRLATEAELATPSTPPARTLIGPVRPAYSRRGKTALVMFHYAWSMHTAVAQYLVEKSLNGWSVKCSMLKFYP